MIDRRRSLARLATVASVTAALTALGLAACSKASSPPSSTSSTSASSSPAPAAPSPSAPAAPHAPDASRVQIAVTKDGFSPEHITVPAAKPVVLVFDRTTDETCAKEVVLEVAGKELRRDLPLNQPVEVPVTFPTAGDLTYACGMDMEHGTITVQ
ncbi:MAG TPA: cupredoxin domain-containing protein [Kofleriaceae bacterium]|nr:cupredoxin domain-containing protein [Kofleriaceae bacterium]